MDIYVDPDYPIRHIVYFEQKLKLMNHFNDTQISKYLF